MRIKYRDNGNINRKDKSKGENGIQVVKSDIDKKKDDSDI